ncbi:MAG: hypothetical protein AAGC97_16745, partial [Planctomycetota bacterium]
MLTQSLESRQLLAGPELISIEANDGDLIRNGTSLDDIPAFGTASLQASPTELVFRFDDEAALKESSIGQIIQVGVESKQPAIAVTRAGDDRQFESAAAVTDFGTGGAVLVEFRSKAAGVSGNGTIVRIV